MLTNKPFFHGVIRKSTIAFAGLFGNIYLRNRDKDGKSQKIVKVPIAYSNKDKMLVRLNSDPQTREGFLVTLPRIGFEIMNVSYASERSLNKHAYKVTDDGFTNYSPAPYNIEFALYTYTKTTEDNLMIMEQILPFFRPDLTLKIDMLPGLNDKQNIPLILSSVTTDEVVEGDFEERRAIITTYNFTMKVNMFGPMLGEGDAENHFEDGSSGYGLVKHVIIDVNTGKYTADVNPETANINDAFVIDENWTYDE